MARTPALRAAAGPGACSAVFLELRHVRLALPGPKANCEAASRCWDSARTRSAGPRRNSAAANA